jgi:hypothetical protein
MDSGLNLPEDAALQGCIKAGRLHAELYYRPIITHRHNHHNNLHILLYP